MEFFELANGLQIPAIGSGTNSFGKDGGSFSGTYSGDPKDALTAIAAGYRLFDTAESYGNEDLIGRAVAESGLPRDAFFISTKMKTHARGSEPAPKLGAEGAGEALERSLAKLGTDYIDLYLIHSPCDDPAETAKIWHAFEQYYRQGVLKAIGVSNFSPAQLEALLAEAEVAPMVNQVRINPLSPNEETVAFCQAHGIRPMAWCPLNFDASYREPIGAIGAKYGKSWSQTVLRYQFQRGIITIPKSHNAEHQKQNLDIFDFALNAEDMAAMAAIAAN